MKILFFIDRLFAGGRQRRVVELIKSLSNRGNYEIAVVVMRKEIHYEEILQLINVRIFVLERKIKKDITIFYKFYKIAKNFNPDIIHVWSNLQAIYAIPTKVLLRKKLINNQITDAPEYIKNRFINFLIPSYFSDIVISNSYAGLNAYNAPSKKSLVIYNGFNFDRIKKLKKVSEIRNLLNVKTKFIIGMVASFSKFKDYNTYFSAATIILSKRKDVTFLAVGQWDYSKYKNDIEACYLQNIIFLNQQKEIESIMNICDIGVLSTFTEGLPNVVLEFMALGKPVIATDGGGTKELLLTEGGYLIPKKKPEILAEKIEILLNNKKLRNKMGNFNKRRINEFFSIEKMVNSFIDIYES